MFRENWDFLRYWFYTSNKFERKARTNELVHLHCVCCSVALLARTCTCFASPSRLHHRRRRFRKCRPLWRVARGRFRIPSGPTTRFARVPRADDSFEFFQGGERDQARAPSWYSQLQQHAREKKVEPQIVLYCGKLTDDRYRKPEIIPYSVACFWRPIMCEQF